MNTTKCLFSFICSSCYQINKFTLIDGVINVIPTTQCKHLRFIDKEDIGNTPFRTFHFSPCYKQKQSSKHISP